MFEFLNRPYPFSFKPLRSFKQLVITSLCIFAFYVSFKPFGLDRDSEYVKASAYLAFSGFIIGFFTFILIPFFLPKIFNESRWTLKRSLIWSLCVFFIFSFFMLVAYILYYIRNDSFHFTFKFIFWWLNICLIFGVPILLISNLVNQYYLLKKHVKIAANINHSIEFRNESIHKSLLELEVDRFTKVNIDINSILYIEALGNYLNIIYQKNEVKKITIRETINNIEKKISSPILIYKPHRSYLVNLQHIHHITGDAQGLKIHIKDIDNVIPVSRTKIKEFRRLASSKMG